MKLWRNRAYYSYWISDVGARLIFGSVFYKWQEKFNTISLLIIASVLSNLGSGALLVVSVIQPESGVLYPVPSVLYGAANGIFWMVGS